MHTASTMHQGAHTMAIREDWHGWEGAKAGRVCATVTEPALSWQVVVPTLKIPMANLWPIYTTENVCSVLWCFCVFPSDFLNHTPSVAPPPSLKMFPLLLQDSLPSYSRILTPIFLCAPMPARCPAKCKVLPYTGSTWKQQCLFLFNTCPLEHGLQLWNIENNSEDHIANI